jgi:hypothetical protein
VDFLVVAVVVQDMVQVLDQGLLGKAIMAVMTLLLQITALVEAEALVRLA